MLEHTLGYLVHIISGISTNTLSAKNQPACELQPLLRKFWEYDCWWQLKKEMKSQTVILITFLGTVTPKKKTDPKENYWQLIGKRGKVIDDRNMASGEVLVLFEDNLDEYGLHNHNPIKNSLWIRVSDLKSESQNGDQ